MRIIFITSLSFLFFRLWYLVNHNCHLLSTIFFMDLGFTYFSGSNIIKIIVTIISCTTEGKTNRMSDTYLSHAIMAADDAGPQYDANIKYLLADKQILARIIKYTVKEFADMPINHIIGSIGDDIGIGIVPTAPGLSNLGRASLSATEDNIPGEGSVFYDIRFTAFCKDTEMKFLINVEAQKSSDPGRLGYHLENRIVFYLSRMISAQNQTEFFHSEYDGLKPVRSIWICMDSEDEAGSIEEIVLNKKTVFGRDTDTREIDLFKGIIVNLRSNSRTTSPNTLIAMLESLLSGTDTEEKKRILTENYGMIMTAELEGRIRTMCNLSENIRELGIQRGMEKGMEKGIKSERLHTIERMRKAGFTKEQIKQLGYTESEFAEADASLYAETVE